MLNLVAVNSIDASALESLELIIHRLADQKIDLHLSEVKGPVMDRLARSALIDDLTGNIFLSHHEAMAKLAPEVTDSADRSQMPDIDASRPSPERPLRQAR